MDARFYNSEEIDIERLARDVVNAFLAQGYQAQNLGNKDQMIVQLKKGGDFEAFIGMQAALTLTVQKTTGGVLAMVGQQRWIDKAAVGAVGIVLPILWPLAVTAGVGALRQASLGNQVLNMVDGLVRQQVPEVQVGPVPYNVMPQAQQRYTPPPAYTPPPYTPPPYTPPQPAYVPQQQPAPVAQQLRCSSCNTPYEAGDTFCSGCGRSLTPARLYCTKCNSEVKPGAAFCPKCGSSTFQTAQGTPVTPTPSPAPGPRVTYTQPKPQPPVYTPPQKPPVPVYTPPATPAYTPPPQPTPSVTVVSSQQPATPARPEVPAYVPPTPQVPSVVPQPKVTIVQGQKKEDAQPSAPPTPPQKVYYTPSSQAQQAAAAVPQPDQATLPQQQQPTASAQPVAPSQPAPSVMQYYTPSLHSQPTIADQPQQSTQQQPASAAPWGVLILPSGVRVQLKGEHPVVGRFDHDLSDDQQPDVDLSSQQGADTISRFHAAFEYTGGAYTLTDLNSTNATRINNKRLEADKPTPINDGDTLQFGKVSCTFKRL